MIYGRCNLHVGLEIVHTRGDNLIKSKLKSAARPRRTFPARLATVANWLIETEIVRIPDISQKSSHTSEKCHVKLKCQAHFTKK